ncbi:MAG: cytochrome c3 family protein [Acidobacteria bacterium]|nr:cytochrome c3 family protein [Acidobacteriota bacterium]
MVHTVSVLALMAAAQLPELKTPRPAPEQPLPFSHKIHAALLKCNGCHTMADPGDFAGLPATAKCMECHSAIRKESPHIQKLAQAHGAGEKLKWAPVYRIPEWVSFNHRQHVAVEGVTCESCHGAVAQREVLRRERDISMQACMECHRQKKASNDCLLCHDRR